MDWTQREVIASDGVRLAGYDGGHQDGPPVLLVHGFPDDHHVWDGVAAALAARFRVLAFDVRGAGESAVPGERTAYRLDQLAADITAVAATAGGQPVHLVAHDWGSSQAWHAVTRDGAPSRFASFTSISGPDLAMAGGWLRHALRHDRRAALRQMSSSWYLQLFRLPVVPQLIWRSGLGFRSSGRPSTPAGLRNALNGLNLYKANMGRPGGAGPTRRCEVPVLVLAPRFDPYIGVKMQTEAPARWTSSLRTEVVDGGHWVLEKHPERVSEAVAAFVAAL